MPSPSSLRGIWKTIAGPLQAAVAALARGPRTDRDPSVHRMAAAVARIHHARIHHARIHHARIHHARTNGPRIGLQEPRLLEAKSQEVVALVRTRTTMNHRPAPTDLVERTIAHRKGEDATIDRVHRGDVHQGIRHRPRHRWTESEKYGGSWYQFLWLVLDQSPIAATMKELIPNTARQGLSQG